LQHLGSSLEGAEPALLVAEIETIEALVSKTNLKAKFGASPAVRCECFAWWKTAKLKIESRWLDALAKLDFIQRLQTSFKVQLPAAALTQLDRSNLGHEANRRRIKKSPISILLGELHHRIQQSEEKDHFGTLRQTTGITR